MAYKYKILAIVAPLIVLLDQGTKYIVVTHLPIGASLPFIPGCWDWVHLRNTGAAFGLLANAPAFLREPFFYGISIVAVIALVVIFIRMNPLDRKLPFSFALIAGGVLGNGIDRLRWGEVVDFISWHVGNASVGGVDLIWPAFNVADSAITASMVLLFIHLSKKEKESS